MMPASLNMHNRPLHRLDHTEEAIGLLVNTGGEEELVGLSCLPTKAEHQRPQTINDNGVAFLVGELTQEGAGIGIECVDVAIAEIADQQIMAELAKRTACESQAPRRVQLTVCYQPLDEMAVGIEDIDDPMAGTRDVTILLCILFGIRDVEFATEILNVKRRIPPGEVWIGEGAREGGRSKILIEHIDGARVDIGGIKEDPRLIGGDGKSFVDCPRF